MSKLRPGRAPGARLTALAALVGAAAIIATAAPAPAAVAGDAPTAEVVPGTGTETPSLVDGIAEPTKSTGSAEDAAREHLAAHLGRYAIGAPQRDLTAADTVTRGGDQTVRFQQKYHGVEVLGGQYLVRMAKKDGQRVVTGTSGKFFTELTVGTTPQVSEEVAVRRAIDAVRQSAGGTYAKQAGPAVNREKDRGGSQAGGRGAYTGTARGLTVLPQGSGVLTRHVTVRGTDATGTPVVQEVYIDARTGYPTLRYSAIRTFQAPVNTSASEAGSAANRKATTPTTDADGRTAAAESAGVVSGSGTALDGRKVKLGLTQDPVRGEYLMVDHRPQQPAGESIATWDARDAWVYETSGAWPEGIEEFGSPTTDFGAEATASGAVDAHWAAGQVYDYYKKNFARNSLDGRGMTINSLVGVTDFGEPYVNAFWDGTKMVYGSGDSEYLPMSADLDVVGHEMTHGVVEHSANLVYVGQSGAMNEAIADYFGNAIDVTASKTSMSDPDAGLLGEDLCRTAGPRDCAIRDLNDGATTSKNFLGLTYDFDYGAVHSNSTIFGGALWDLREDLGGELADQIVYRALTEYMTALDGFTEGRAAVIAAAKDLGVRGAKLDIVKRSFDAHGIVPGWEKALGMDSQTLLGKLNMSGGPQAADGWWTAAKSNDDGSALPTVYAGRTNGKGSPIQVSDNNGRANVSPSTDGKTVVWAAWGPSSVDIMSRPLSGGVPKVLYTSTWGIGTVKISGGDIAFTESDMYGVVHVKYLRAGDRVATQVDEDPDSQWVTGSGVPSLKDGKLVYAKDYVDENTGFSIIGVEVTNLNNGKATRLDPESNPYSIIAPTMTSKSVFWAVDETGFDDNHTAVRRANANGTGRTDIVKEVPGDEGLWAMDLTASDTTVTLTTLVPDTVYRNETSPKLQQFTTDGKPLGRVSCNRGLQWLASADTGTRVVWVDGTTSNTDLVTRERPAGRCA